VGGFTVAMNVEVEEPTNFEVERSVYGIFKEDRCGILMLFSCSRKSGQ
jgi:hypothetical protein